MLLHSPAAQRENAMKARIRRMTRKDFAAALALWQSVKGVGLDPAADSPAGLAAYLRHNPGLSFVAEVGGQLVGAALCGHDGRRGYLHHLAVAAIHRRQGIGQALAARCLAALGSAGIEKCHLFVFSNNRAGQKFWKSTGWQWREELQIMSQRIAAAKRK